MNMGMTTTVSGARSFPAFQVTITAPETRQTNIFTTHIIPDEGDDDSFQPRDPVETIMHEDATNEPVSNESQKAMTPEHITTLIDMEPVTHVIPEDQEPTSFDPH